MQHSVEIFGKTFVPLITAEEIHAAVVRVAADLDRNYVDRNPLLIAVLNGAFVFAADLVRAMHSDPEISFVKVASYRNMESSGQVTPLIGLNTDLTGRDIVVVEDIVDTGHTIAFLKGLLSKMGAARVSFAALLFKRTAYQYDIPIDYVGIEIPDRFVVGYGLDYDGHGRTLESVYVLQQETD